MRLQYNGITMELLQLDRVERDSVYTEDGQDLLYVKWVIGATCVYSPGGYPRGTALLNRNRDVNVLNNNPNADLVGVDPVFDVLKQESNDLPSLSGPSGFNAAITDIELRTRLWTPRQKLIIFAADDKNGKEVKWLDSPKSGLGSDVAGGPKPIAVDVVSSLGEGQTFGIHFQIETSLSPCPNGSDRAIISHRWQMEHQCDEDHYLTRIINGTVVFDVGRVMSAGFNPDNLRNQIYHPIPLGFKRTLGPIIQSSDGSTIKYQIIDVDQTCVFDAGDSGATEMSIVENLSYAQPWRFL